MGNPFGGMSRFLLKLFGSHNERVVKKLWPLVHQVNALEDETSRLSDSALRGKTAEFRERLAKAK